VATDAAEAAPRRAGNKKLVESFMIAVAVGGRNLQLLEPGSDEVEDGKLLPCLISRYSKVSVLLAVYSYAAGRK